MDVENCPDSHKAVENQLVTMYERFCGRAGVFGVQPGPRKPMTGR